MNSDEICSKWKDDNHHVLNLFWIKYYLPGLDFLRRKGVITTPEEFPANLEYEDILDYIWLAHCDKSDDLSDGDDFDNSSGILLDDYGTSDYSSSTSDEI